MSDSIQTIVSILSIILASIAFLYSHYTNTKAYEIKNMYRTNLNKWFYETNLVIIQLKLESESEYPNLELKRNLLSKFSALIDYGRLYFPNINKEDNYGVEKPIAFQGYRNLILSYCVYIYDEHKKESNINEKKLIYLHREFASLFLEITDPAAFVSETKKHTNVLYGKSVTWEDFIIKNPNWDKF